jgi:hypothetical protein
MSTNGITTTARSWNERLRFPLSVVLASACVSAFFIYSSAHLQRPTILAFLGLTVLFSLTLPFAIWRLARYTSRWNALFVITAVVIIPGLDGIFGATNRLIYIPAYIVAVAAIFLAGKRILACSQPAASETRPT